MGKRDENKREFLMLAGTYDESKLSKRTGEMLCIDPTGWYMSEKLDGMRCFWDGGLTQGMVAGDVPWANTDKGGASHKCTGLWSRGAKVIHCPKWFTKGLPWNYFLDGELWNPEFEHLQDITSIARAHSKEEEWKQLKYWIFDSPTAKQFLRAGRIHIRDWEVQLPDMCDWARENGLNNGMFTKAEGERIFQDFIDDWVDHEVYLDAEYATVLPQELCESREHLNAYLESIVAGGGEGVMLRRPQGYWNARRARGDCQKVKKFYDAEAEVIGITFGKETEKDSRLRGMIGALVVRELETGHVFQLAGLNDSERVVYSAVTSDTDPDPLSCGKRAAFDLPNETVIWDPQLAESLSVSQPDLNVKVGYHWLTSVTFSDNMTVTFKYWDRTKDGIPKFAQFWREKTYE